MNRALVTIFTALLSACNATPAENATSEKERRALEIPEDLKDTVQNSESVGTEIFERDMAAWKATDFFLELGVLQSNPNLKGWITERTGQKSYKVTFIGEKQGIYLGYYQVKIYNGEISKENYSINESGFDLSETQKSRFNARQKAVSVEFLKCSDSYNTVVIGEDTENKTVYLLASSNKHGEVHAGGNHQVTVDPAGESVLGHQALSKSCLNLQKKEGVVALTLSHIVTPAPTPIHVFHSLRHNIPFYILTVENDYIWYVNGDEISIIDQIER